NWYAYPFFRAEGHHALSLLSTTSKCPQQADAPAGWSESRKKRSHLRKTFRERSSQAHCCALSAWRAPLHPMDVISPRFPKPCATTHQHPAATPPPSVAPSTSTAGRDPQGRDPRSVHTTCGGNSDGAHRPRSISPAPSPSVPGS